MRHARSERSPSRLWTVVFVLILSLLLAPARASAMEPAVEDPTSVVDAQIAAVGSVAASASDCDATRWLDAMDEVLTRVALGALPALPPSAFAALDTLNASVATCARLERSPAVLRAVLRLVPSLWAMAFWYVPLREWEPAFGGVYSRSVSAAKRAADAALYDAAVNATARVVRFTKDNVFMDGQDHGGALPPPSDEYMAYLPALVAQTSRVEGWRVSEAQLRAFMDQRLHSKLDGMDTTAAYPTFVDTQAFWADDADKMRAFVAQDPPQVG